jgi:hypothetical protein
VLTCLSTRGDPTDPMAAETEAITVAWIKGYIGDDVSAAEPLTAIYYPILDEANDAVSVADLDNGSTKLVGVIAM